MIDHRRLQHGLNSEDIWLPTFFFLFSCVLTIDWEVDLILCWVYLQPSGNIFQNSYYKVCDMGVALITMRSELIFLFTTLLKSAFEQAITIIVFSVG